MVLKRQYNEKESDNSSIAHHHSQTPPIKFRKVVSYVLKELSLQEISTRLSAILEPKLRRMVKEEMESLFLCLQSSPRNSLVHKLDPPISRVLQLHFAKKLPSTLYTNSSIQDEDHSPLKVSLVDSRSKNVIHTGPSSSIKLEVLVLNADFTIDGRESWTESEFRRSIVHQRDGKRPLLIGDCSLSLVNGVGFIGNIFFTDNSSWVRSRKFRLGVRAVSCGSGGPEIREAVSEPFVVLDHRGESYKKRATPLLDDPVWRLQKISKMGASHKKLESHGIMTVKDFLMQYNIDPLFLRHVLGNGVPKRAWETMVRHANECRLDNTRYSYYNAAERVALVFNCVYKVIEVTFDEQGYQPVDALASDHKTLVDKLKKLAFNRNELVPVHSFSETHSLSSTVQQNSAPFGVNVKLQEDGPSIINQAEPKQKLNFNFFDSASHPCTFGDGYLHDDDSTAQSNQHTHYGFSPAAFLMDDTETDRSIQGCTWYQTGQIQASIQNTHFGEPSQPQTSPVYPNTTPWELDSGLITTSISASHVGFLSEFGIDIPGTPKSKAGWCKIRAAVKWKIVRRNAARRKVGLSSYCY